MIISFYSFELYFFQVNLYFFLYNGFVRDTNLQRGIRGTVVVHLTADQQVERSILHQGDYS